MFYEFHKLQNKIYLTENMSKTIGFVFFFFLSFHDKVHVFVNFLINTPNPLRMSCYDLDFIL